MFRPAFSGRDLEKLRREMNQLFESTVPWISQRSTTGFPAFNVWANNEEGLLVTAELPGVSSEDIDISVTGDTLTVKGSLATHDESDQAQFHRRERRTGEFSRSFQLPFSINKEQVNASLEKGVLQISLPRAEAEKPKQIHVQAS